MKLPYITLVSTTSIDGKIRGLREGERLSEITPLSRKVTTRIHELRAKSDAILVGANTIRLDNPHLTVRYAKYHKKPWRVTLSTKGNINLKSNFYDGEAPTILITTQGAPKTKIKSLKEKGIKVIITGSSQIDLHRAFGELRNLNIKKVMVEGGPTIISNLLNEKLVSKAILITYPFLLGGDMVVPTLTKRLNHPIKAKLLQIYKLDNFVFKTYELMY